MNITMKTEEYQKISKTVYKLINTKVEPITPEQLDNITNDSTLKWFRSIGGSERRERTYTNFGYQVVRLVSKSPDKETKTS